jgi:hypothetical protein
MNALIVGTGDTTAHFLDHLPPSYLLIDDGSLIDKIQFPQRRKITILDFNKHSFNPLSRINYEKASRFVDIISAIFPAGEHTLTKQNTSTILLEALLDNPRHLSTLVPETKDTMDAHNKIKRLLLSPVLERFLTRPTNFPLTGIVIARMRGLTDFDRFAIANILIANYQGHIVIPDFGFYGCPFHTSLTERMTVGAKFLDQLSPALRRAVLLIPDKIPCRTTTEDAETLVGFTGLLRGTNEYNDYLAQAVGA